MCNVTIFLSLWDELLFWLVRVSLADLFFGCKEKRNDVIVSSVMEWGLVLFKVPTIRRKSSITCVSL